MYITLLFVILCFETCSFGLQYTVCVKANLSFQFSCISLTFCLFSLCVIFLIVFSVFCAVFSVFCAVFSVFWNPTVCDFFQAMDISTIFVSPRFFWRVASYMDSSTLLWANFVAKSIWIPADCLWLYFLRLWIPVFVILFLKPN